MADYSLEKFQTKLDKNISWRKRELTILKNNVDAAEGNLLVTSIRSGITLLYGHWEGFIKTTAREYLKYLNKLNIKCIDMKDNFITLSMKKTIVNSRQSNRCLSHSEIISELLYESEKIFNVNEMDKLIVDTDSNLTYEILEDILFSLGLDCEDFEMKENFIKENLVLERNKIAHGEYVSIVDPRKDKSEEEKRAKDEFENLYHEILKLMEKFKELVFDAAYKKKYLKQVPELSV
ncbi:MAE_28990/MAE_18760 family HEPN-like nuclease [Paenibacillus provencensis]|uniref:MAE_28990/MAE_18760 family HEPN-like nuclease n=1 Tax=Paenibacillus provencensis TaxID=441151 RepID=A0ABW3PTG3_9BACL|nr:MAE_28990/MAE_18760 family HEPN-like nuclease [Paenibacillus sp. MER 78]MCM3128629.1 MAE_28990/MAE_18760 family HEPN-like nuclease [Paenibacillus sp. MER 78]